MGFFFFAVVVSFLTWCLLSDISPVSNGRQGLPFPLLVNSTHRGTLPTWSPLVPPQDKLIINQKKRTLREH